ncbi:class I SAM-dependent methyltransferase [Mycobacterium sp. 94-17]|uniref:class I SAM-dependent methyltransferase n=1 Tax=Mycobacterium sp. 94-17 TaxID=2986147 RepID=UPI002D1F8240|nr:class I SAM-dependent methyltransferase [Mycobacterium sp. 94-17]MEB4212038.1 class I SAM-dependent methyltransferase [Mycobacterium sp. 94-17]
MITNGASKTAVLICQARAIADDRLAVGRFSDPFAARLLRDAERVPVERARSGAAPDSWRERMEAALLGRNMTISVARAVVIDDAVRAKAHPQLVILGAGLDARAYRLPELAGADVYEVDFPATQQDKRDRINGLRPVAKSLNYVSVDFQRDALGAALAAAGHDTATPTTWICEGVLPYLTKTDVDSTLAAIDECSAPGSRFILTYSTPAGMRLGLKRWWLNSVVDRSLQLVMHLSGAWPAEDEPYLSSWYPEEMHAQLAAHNFLVTDDQDLYEVARQLGISARVPRVAHAAIADKPAAR